MGRYDRQRKTAIAAIAKYGELVTYYRNQEGAPIDGKDWKTGPTETTPHKIAVLFIPKSGSKKLFEFMANGNVQTGGEVAYLSGLGFEPTLLDEIERSNGVRRRIKTISPLKPNGEDVILYEMELQE